MALDRPVHAPEAADGTEAPVVTAPVAPGTSAHDGLAEVHPPGFFHLASRG